MLRGVEAVATREGGVDRNTRRSTGMMGCRVATREGGVDRNWKRLSAAENNVWSPPARVAWIETFSGHTHNLIRHVATREGGVDRNPSNCRWC